MTSGNRDSQTGGTARIRPHVHWTKIEEVTLLLNMNTGRYFAFDKVAALIWEDLSLGITHEQTAARLVDLYGIEFSKARVDVQSFLSDLEKKGLVDFGCSFDLRAQTSSFSSPTLNKTFALCRNEDAGKGLFEPLRDTRSSNRIGGYKRVLLFVEALSLLIWIDLSLHLRGFTRLWLRFSKMGLPLSRPQVDQSVVSSLTHIALQAFRWYRPGVACMHRALVTFCFLKRKGILAELCLGVRTNPFGSHVWVESEGFVLDDAADIGTRFRTIAKVSSYERNLLHTSLRPTTS